MANLQEAKVTYKIEKQIRRHSHMVSSGNFILGVMTQRFSLSLEILHELSHNRNFISPLPNSALKTTRPFEIETSSEICCQL